MNKISTDSALTLLPTAGKPSYDDARTPAFVEHLDRARAERTPTTNCPPPPATPTVCKAPQSDSNQSPHATGSSGDDASRNPSGAAIDQTPHDERPEHDDEPVAADEVELSSAAVAVADPATSNAAEAHDKKLAAGLKGKNSLRATGKFAPPSTAAGATAADAAVSAATKPTTPNAVAEAALQSGAAEAAAAPIATELETALAKTSQTTPIETELEQPSPSGAASTRPVRPTIAKNLERNAKVDKTVGHEAAPQTTPSAPSSANTTAIATAVPDRSATGRTSATKRDSGSKQDSVIADDASPLTQILVSAEPTAVGTTVVTADRLVDAARLASRDTHDGSSPNVDAATPVDIPRDNADTASRANSTTAGETRPNHAGRLEGIPVAGRPGSSGIHDQISQADRVRLVQRVSRALQSAAERGGEVRLRLSPPELGSLRMEVIVQHGQLSAHIETETSAAKFALLDNLPALRSRLAEQEITVARFDVDVMDNPADGNHQQYDQDGDWSRQGSGVRTNSAARPKSDATEPTRSTRTATGLSGELNIVV